MNRSEPIKALQQELRACGCDAFLLPSGDAFLSEYPPESARRLRWLSGFDGSAGSLLVLCEPPAGVRPALLFTDGRYTLQARGQLDESVFEVIDSAEQRPQDWLEQHLPDAVMGYDAWLHPHAQLERWSAVHSKALAHNPVDRLWKDRPAQPAAPASAHPMNYAGQTSDAKRARLMQAIHADALLLTQPDGINWLLNIRGNDIAFNPLALCYALLEADGAMTLISLPRDWPDLQDVKHVDLAQFMAAPETLFEQYDTLQLDASAVPEALWQAASKAGCELIDAPDPSERAKAIKNETEIAGMREAHRRDGRALTRFLHWLSQQKDGFDELGAAGKLEALRRAESGDLYRGPSFDTISGIGPNGAIVHYRVSAQTNRRSQPGQLYLVDSGGQYPDGTTDVTRTIVCPGAPPTPEMIDRYTRVLKGHIAIARAVFPRGTSGSQLDTLARQYLWEIGEDYAHGTGHGVGSYLCVHEGPQRISKRGGDVALEAGMILSNEPGYYKEGEYGIRIENLVLVVAAEQTNFLRFETLTLAALEARLIDRAMLTAQEIAWLDAYEAQVRSNG